MLQGLEIMLERMKTHPEEFVAQNKYTKAIHRVRPFLNDEELNALREAVIVAHRDYFNGEVLSTMSGEENTARMAALILGTCQAMFLITNDVRRYPCPLPVQDQTIQDTHGTLSAKESPQSH